MDDVPMGNPPLKSALSNATKRQQRRFQLQQQHPSSSPPPPQKRGVTFYPNVFVYDVDCDFTVAETRAAWYNVQEIRRIKEDYLMTIHIVTIHNHNTRQRQHNLNKTNGSSSSSSSSFPLHHDVYNPEEHCMRGLEYRTPEGWERRSFMKRYAREAVLLEQDRIWAQQQQRIQQCHETGNDIPMFDEQDDEAVLSIAKVYQEFSSASQQFAHRMGLEDEGYVFQQYCQEHQQHQQQRGNLRIHNNPNTATTPTPNFTNGKAQVQPNEGRVLRMMTPTFRAFGVLAGRSIGFMSKAA